MTSLEKGASQSPHVNEALQPPALPVITVDKVQGMLGTETTFRKFQPVTKTWIQMTAFLGIPPGTIVDSKTLIDDIERTWGVRFPSLNLRNANETLEKLTGEKEIIRNLTDGNKTAQYLLDAHVIEGRVDTFGKKAAGNPRNDDDEGDWNPPEKKRIQNPTRLIQGRQLPDGKFMIHLEKNKKKTREIPLSKIDIELFLQLSKKGISTSVLLEHFGNREYETPIESREELQSALRALNEKLHLWGLSIKVSEVKGLADDEVCAISTYDPDDKTELTILPSPAQFDENGEVLVRNPGKQRQRGPYHGKFKL